MKGVAAGFQLFVDSTLPPKRLPMQAPPGPRPTSCFGSPQFRGATLLHMRLRGGNGSPGPHERGAVDVQFTFHTIGHSTRSIDEFVDLLRVGAVRLVVDIRTVRRSRRNPQYNFDALPASLAPFGIGYLSIPELGGLRKQAPDTPSCLNAFWINRSFHNYADYALSDSFRQGLEQLIEAGRREPCSIMCSEAVWWRCHRRIVADYLILRGEKVFHLMGKDRAEEAVMTRGAEATEAGFLHYPTASKV
jgi:hypothetical protein